LDKKMLLRGFYRDKHNRLFSERLERIRDENVYVSDGIVRFLSRSDFLSLISTLLWITLKTLAFYSPDNIIPIIITTIMAVNIVVLINSGNFIKKSEAYVAANDTIANSPSRFAKYSLLSLVQNIFCIVKNRLAHSFKYVKYNKSKSWKWEETS